MKKLILTLFLIPTVVFGQLRDSVYIKGPIFEGIYSEVLEQPLYISYFVKCTEVTESRKGMDFYKNDSVKTSDAKDYVKNVWDKGHMAPAADFACDYSDLKATFSYLNCALQHKKLNRGPWRILEDHERDLLAQYGGKIWVEIIPVYDQECEVLPTGATVPRGFYKYIWQMEPKQMVLESYYFPNDVPKEGTTYRDYKLNR